MCASRVLSPLRCQGRSSEAPFLAEFTVAAGGGAGARACVMTAVFKCVDEGATEAAVKVRPCSSCARCGRLIRWPRGVAAQRLKLKGLVSVLGAVSDGAAADHQAV
jgi:hypothetical protein